MLLIALMALVLGVVALYFEMADYKFKFRGAPSVSALVGQAASLAVGPACRAGLRRTGF